MSGTPFDFSGLVSGPYDSPMEAWFLHHLMKYLAPNAAYEDHVAIDTMCGPFVVDYVVRTSRRAVGFEVDGRDFHQDEVRDEYRDAAILETGKLDTIYRLPAGALHRYPEECLLAVARADPELISDRGRVNLERLAHDAPQLSAGDDPPLLHFWIWPSRGELPEDEEPVQYPDDPRESNAPSRIDRWNGRPPYQIQIRRHRAQLMIASLINAIRRYGPASLDEVRRRAQAESAR